MKNKKNIVFMAIGAITLIVATLGATYAYFTAQSSGGANIDTNVITGTTDNLSFQTGRAINLTANQEDFGEGAGNKSGSTFARATLTANNATNNATRNYYVYLDITNNDFEYTTEDEQAELLLKVTDPDGTEVTTLGSLERKTSGGETGFDITTQTGLITIADNYTITSTGTVTQEWQVEVIFANLDSDQNANTGKSFSAILIVREDSPIEITSIDTSNITIDSITLTVNFNSENPIAKYYFTKNEEEYVESENNTYTFTNLNVATKYVLKAYAIDNNGYQSAVYSTEATTSDYTYLSNYITSLYTIDGENGLYLHDADLANGANDNNYRYAGANPNNYVCFGSDATVCPTDNLYRIIGVFENRVKIVKFSNIGSYPWRGNNSNSSNNWQESTLNTEVLNGTYLNTLESKWSDLIATTSWKVGGNTYQNIYAVVVNQAYKNEIINPVTSTTYNAKIGLIYVSDYGYAASPESWNTTLVSYNNGAMNTDWLYTGTSIWTITRRSDINYSFYLVDSGNVHSDIVSNSKYIYPSFYLLEDVRYISGIGTQTDPYRIA